MEYTVDIINQIAILLIFVTSLNILMGYAGQATVAQAAIGGVGGYTAGFLSAHHGMPFFASILIGMCVAGIVGTVVSLPALRLTWDYLVLLTLAVATVFTDVVSSAPQFGGAYGILGVLPISVAGRQLESPVGIFPVVGGLAAVVFLICWRLGESPFGRVLKAIRGDEIATRSLGKSTYTFKVLTFGIVSGLAGLGGALLVFYDQLVTPDQFSLDQAILFVTMLVFGGSGNLLGSVVGTVVIGASGPLLQQLNLGTDQSSLIQLIVYGSAVVLLMRFRPQGVLRERSHFWDRCTRLDVVASGRAIPALSVRLAGTSAVAAATPGGGRVATIVQQSGDPVQPEGAERSREELERSPLSAELVATGLKKHFGGITAVDGVDVTIRAGELLGLIGPNGAGKSTLFSLLTGFIAPDEGQIAFRGKSILGQSANKIANMGLVRSFQDVRLIPELTVLDNVALAWRTNSGEQLVSLFCAPRKAKRSEAMARTEAMRWLEFVGMQQQRGRRAGDLAHAEQKLVALARVLMTGGEILLLDEPTSGVEHRWIEQLAAVIAELPSLGRGVCVVEHNLTFLRMLNAPCLFMEGGRVAASGTLDELMSVDDMRRAYFGI